MQDRSHVPIGPESPILDVMASMRAMRRLRPDPVPDELLHKVIEAASWAPSASHLQRYQFVLVTDREQMKRLAPIWQAVVNLYLATFAQQPDDLDDEMFGRTVDSVRDQAARFAEVPALIVACYDFGSYPNAVRRRMMKAPGAFRRFGLRRTMTLLRTQGTFANRSEAASIYPAVQNLLLAARTHGLAANISTWHLMAEKEVKRILGIPRNIHTYALIPIGWPRGNFGPVRRKPVKEMIHRDRW